MPKDTTGILFDTGLGTTGIFSAIYLNEIAAILAVVINLAWIVYRFVDLIKNKKK